jgi:TPR repeat protein
MQNRIARAELLVKLRSLRYDMNPNIFDVQDLSVVNVCCELSQRQSEEIGLMVPGINYGSYFYFQHQQEIEEVRGLTACLEHLVHVYSSSTSARFGGASDTNRVQRCTQEEDNRELVYSSQQDIHQRPPTQPLADTVTQQQQHCALFDLPDCIFNSILDRVSAGAICSVLRTSCKQMRATLNETWWTEYCQHKLSGWKGFGYDLIQTRSGSAMDLAMRLCPLLLQADWQFAAAAAEYELAIVLGQGPQEAYAELAWLKLFGREGLPKGMEESLQVAEAGMRLGCVHCTGIVAYCFTDGCERLKIDRVRALQLARESAAAGSRYGQFVLGRLHWFGWGGLAMNVAEGLMHFRLAAAQGLDQAQRWLGMMYRVGSGLAPDQAEALRWYRKAADQGLPYACYEVAHCYEDGRGVAANRTKAIRWYKVALAAGWSDAANHLRRFGLDRDDSNEYDDNDDQ